MTGWVPYHQRAPGRVALILIAALALTLATAAAFTIAPGAQAAQGDYDYDCTDFDTRDDAQVFYEQLGGPSYDPYNLDDDEDGTACEEWEQSYAHTRAPLGKDGEDRDCADFSNQSRAQRYFEEDGGSAAKNIDRLDPNHTGIACEHGEPG
jgi:hypothetical protein